MATSPKSRSSRRVRIAAAAVVGATLLAGFAAVGHADDVPIVPIVLTPPTTSVVVTLPPTTTPIPTTTEAPLPTLPTTTPAPTVAPTAATTSTVAPTIPTTVPPTTPPPTTNPPRPTTTKPKGNPNATGPASVEVDISSQTLFLRKGGVLVRTLHVSTGSGRRFCNKGKCQTAHTPRGRYRIQRRVNGWRTGALGRMYNPMYFSGGYAIHGSGSVPYRPASHGCVRITIGSATWLARQIPNGTPVWVHD